MVAPSNKFYSQVMGFKTPLQRLSGEGITLPKVEERTRTALKNLMLVVFESEAGDQESQKRSFYEKHLKKLNRTELNRLMKKIRLIAALCIEDSDEKEQLEKLAEETIKPILAESAKLTAALHKKILRQLKKFPGLTLVGNQVSYSRNRFSLQGFIKENFAEIAEEYDHLVKNGLLVPNRSEKLGTSFIRHTIKDTFK